MIRQFSKQWLDEEIDEEQFRKEMEQFWGWVSRNKRTRRSWLFALWRWADGDR